jgi:hypothetical protein
MKFSALTLGLALVCGAALADHTKMKASDRKYDSRGVTTYSSTTWTTSPMTSPPATGEYTIHRTVAGTYYTPAIYTDIPSVSEVASKVSEIITKQQHEIAMLQALAPRARTAGFDNVGTVYDVMIADHQRLAGQGSNWLVAYHQPVPSAPATMTVSDVAPEASVDQQIDMHVKSFNESLDRMHNERSSTVRGLLLMGAATAARHITLLRTLDSDIDLGRKTVSARLNMLLGPTGIASSELLTRTVEEETAYWQAHNPPVVAYTPPPIPAQPQVAEVPPPAPAPQPAIQPAPVTTVETPAITRPIPMRSAVAGRKQTIRRTRRPAH